MDWIDKSWIDVLSNHVLFIHVLPVQCSPCFIICSHYLLCTILIKDKTEIDKTEISTRHLPYRSSIGCEAAKSLITGLLSHSKQQKLQ